MESEERKDTKPRVTIFQLISVPSVCVLLMASLFAAGSLTFLDPLLGELFYTWCKDPVLVMHLCTQKITYPGEWCCRMSHSLCKVNIQRTWCFYVVT